jgi:apolipoprotein N-acyltransferase
MIPRILRHPLFLAALGGLLLALAFPSPDWGPLAFFALVPLLIAIDQARPGQAFGLGMAAGFVFFAIVYYWIAVFASAKVGPFGEFAGYLLAAVMAVFVALFASIASWARISGRLGPWARLLLAPSLWVLLEYARQLGSLGMGWGDIGYTQWRDPWMLRVAPLAGVWGISWLVVLINQAIAMRRADALAASIAAIALAIAIGPLGRAGVHPVGAPFVAAALQANINQDVPWKNGRPADPAFTAGTLATFDSMAAQARDRGARLALIAETALPGYVALDYDLRRRAQDMSTRNGLTMVDGGFDYDVANHKDRNVAILFVPDAGPIGPLRMYAKQQLVPFGEFVPFVNELKWLNCLHTTDYNDEAGAADQAPLDDAGGIGKIGVAICYESSYPRFGNEQVRAGANILTVITDDTWFGRTAAAKQHFAMSAVRAAECDRYLVRCAATGISGVFDPNGAVEADAPLFTRSVVAAPVQSLSGETVFVRYGDWMVLLSALIALGCAIASAMPSRAGKQGAAQPVSGESS